ncbi:MAG: bifunctional diaminohydroxyphosphoribosylaminopyrimidine deaminase/5-amino-6-(5-phosphoribosylamino)uracil reductase RibD [Rhodocyclaceae bacterium]|nr:bifunctional diaminohydroxyphosphoribosylaminopyrimidine deaminase/5-amino-6-(5-phosphoribosylamino)uracil reductase RibD [Rhodocyclaceae bacterium]
MSEQAFTLDDHRFMAEALRLAERGLFGTSPNPRVGSVVVKDGQIIGSGWHERAGSPHAEVVALADAARRYGSQATHGATVYVTLEPCAHHGKTPPCTDALLAAGVARVVCACEDPNPLVAGRGIALLRAAHVSVACGLMAQEARELNVGFFARMTRGRPWVRLKIAASLDGRTALANGASQWITKEAARRDVHRWRARSCAILTGIGTVRADNPRLTVRGLDTPRQPLRIVCDSRLSLPLDAAVLENGCLLVHAQADPARMATLAARGAELLALPAADGRIDLPALMQELARRQINELLVEAGATLAGALLRARLVDELLLYQAPLLLGDHARGMADIGILESLSEALRLRIVERRWVGDDQLIRARL